MASHAVVIEMVILQQLVDGSGGGIGKYKDLATKSAFSKWGGDFRSSHPLQALIYVYLYVGECSFFEARREMKFEEFDYA